MINTRGVGGIFDVYVNRRLRLGFVCITVSKSPNPSRVYSRLCKHGKRLLLLKYKSSQVSVSKYIRILPNKFNIQVTLLEMLLMCSCQSIEASKIKPKYFTVFDSSRSLPKKNKEGPCDLARPCLGPKSMTLVLP